MKSATAILVSIWAFGQGCAAPNIPEPPSPEIRESLGLIRIEVDSAEPAGTSSYPPSGCWNGFLRGLGQGHRVGTEAGVKAPTGIVFLAGPILVFVYGGMGAAQAMPPEECERLRRPILATLARPTTSDRMKGALLVSCSSQRGYRVLSPYDRRAPDTRLRVVVEEKRLVLAEQRTNDMSDFLDPCFFVSVRCRVLLERVSDQQILYDEPFRFESGEQRFGAWSKNDGAWTQCALRDAGDWMAAEIAKIVLKELPEGP